MLNTRFGRCNFRSSNVARYNPKDRFYRQAKAQGLRARSAFKLEELLEKIGLRSLKGAKVVDLGAAPGGWLQILARLAGAGGAVVGLDLVAIAPIGPNVTTHTLDIRDSAALERAGLPAGLDLVTSDMAPKTTGIHATDVARSHELVRLALAFAREHLRPGGTFVAKVFMGEGFEDLEREIRAVFAEVRTVRPEATRQGSREIYVAGKGLKASTPPQSRNKTAASPA